MIEIAVVIKNVCKKLFDVDIEPELTRPDEQFGDYATNIALRISKQLGKNPREVAEAIKAEISSDDIVSLEIAGPGFINIRLTDSVLWELAKIQTGKLASDMKVVIETNNPNPFKAMHIGHAFNAIIADTIANLAEYAGAEIHRVSYHGDIGQHVGRSMYSLLKFVEGNPAKLHTIADAERNSLMSKMYAEGSRAYKEDETAKAEIDQLASDSFTREDPVYREVYEVCMDWSFREIDSNVARLGNKPIEKRYLESQADALGVQTVKAHTPGVFIENDGAYVFPGSKYGSFDNVFVSSKGRGLYGARDLGLIQLKHQDFQAQKSMIVTAEEQRDYFKGVIKAAELCLPELAGVTTNISTGTVKLSTGKMSSRDGDVLEIGWLFEQISQAVAQRGSAASDNIVTGALRYQFLKARIGSDVMFDIEESTSLQGNTGPYLQYAHARARSILAKSTVELEGLTTELEADERSLLRKVGEYHEVVGKAVSELMPHLVCTYLYELAQTFNRFYEHNRVIDDPRQSVRLQLVQKYADTLKSGLSILNISAPDHM
ncbi:arginine--tRNA ligase [Candidatus Saccharibacteria bacterium]|nr:arginine--tRNA ligase [Candidatus Saccharibacteria bacterium]